MHQYENHDETINMDKTKIIIIISFLIGLIIVLSSSIGYEKYAQTKIEKEQTIYRQGINDGVNAIVIQIMQQASTCQKVSLKANNQTMEVVSVSCLGARI